ncbi:hypothetical protein [Actinomadura macrotermitis]|uniref:Secreted protein n=1 Tax=Actinomadura macrotermitis TaxID=2585200 RepID=A0A7K0BV48_9ACTN|nr:hypothetical protein [Actinomadura macrotermitis]MQY05017.1 hypothetical protein [Actinomadura macrotermitis]
MLPTPSRPRALTRALVGVLAPAAALLALAPAPAHAADGRYTSDTTGVVTVRNSAGQTIFTCTSLYQQGTTVSATAGQLPRKADYTAAVRNGSTCQRPNGEQGMLIGGDIASIGIVYYTQTAYNPATGVVSLIGNKSTPYGISYLSDGCRFDFDKIIATYTVGTKSLKYISATARPYTTANNDGSIGCPGVKANETITFDAEFKLVLS